MPSSIQQIGETVYSAPVFEIKKVLTRDGRTQYAVYKGGRFKAVFPTLGAAKHSLACSLACSIKYSKSAKSG